MVKKCQVFSDLWKKNYLCTETEDEAWKKSQVDPVVKQLQAADKRQDRSNFVRFAR